MKRHRSVLSRLERVKRLQERGDLNLEQNSFLGLPKVRHLKIRVRKEKAAAPAAAGTPAAGVEASATAPTKAPSSPKAPGTQAKPEAAGPAKKKE